MHVLVVGAGIAGLTAGVLLRRKGHTVTVSDTRDHIGGNCADLVYKGTRVQRYGPHVFHTNDTAVFKFLSEFTSWAAYQHTVGLRVPCSKSLVPLPFSSDSEKYLGQAYSRDLVNEFVVKPVNQKVWGKTKPDNFVNDWFFYSDSRRVYPHDIVALPDEGFEELFIAMADEIGQSSILLRAPSRAEDLRKKYRSVGAFDLIVYTGRIDQYFEYCHGELPYRSERLEFHGEHTAQEYASIIDCDARITQFRTSDFSKLTVAKSPKAVRLTEMPCDYFTGVHNDSLNNCHVPMFAGVSPLRQQYLNVPVASVVFCGTLGTNVNMTMAETVRNAMDAVQNI